VIIRRDQAMPLFRRVLRGRNPRWVAGASRLVRDERPRPGGFGPPLGLSLGVATLRLSRWICLMVRSRSVWISPLAYWWRTSPIPSSRRCFSGAS